MRFAGCNLATVLLLLIACTDRPGTGAAVADATASAVLTEPAPFTDRAAEVGLDFVHFNGMSGEYYTPEVTGAGAALFDADNDGDLDAYLLQGRMLGRGKTLEDALTPPRHPPPLTDRLYRNDLERGAGLAFTDVTAEAGQLGSGYAMGVAAGDYDNDGDVDLYVTQLGSNQLLRNDGGDGRLRFTDVTSAAAVDDDRWSVSAAFFDADGDGWLDLYVGNYVTFPFDRQTRCRDATGARVHCGPMSFSPLPDRLFRNRGREAHGEGREAHGTVTFEDVTASSGLAGGRPGPALGVVTADFNGDGRLDLYVANDLAPNNLWIRRGGDGPIAFTDEALLAGCSVNGSGEAEASMGVDAADFDGDGDLDIFITHLVAETNTLYRNDGRGIFEDFTAASGLGPSSLPFTSFGTGFIDFDNDGFLDLLIANGAVARIEALARAGDPFPLHQPNQLFRNLGGGKFRDISAAAGAELERSEVSRGVVIGDVDNDGDADVLLTNNNGPARLLINAVGHRRQWLGLRLLDGRRDAPGARATVLRDGRPVGWRRVRVAAGFGSANDPRILFGLGDDPRVDGVRVVWPDGTVEEWTEVAVGEYTTLRRGSGRRVE